MPDLTEPTDDSDAPRRRGRPRKSDRPAPIDPVLDAQRRMEQTGQFYFALPNGAQIPVATVEELDQVRLIAQPYVDSADDMPSDSWNDTQQMLNNSLNLDRMNRQLTAIQRRGAEITDPDERRTYDGQMGEVQADIVKQVNQLQRLVIEQRKNLDFVRQSNKGTGGTLAEYLETVRSDALAFAEDHKGEYAWLTTCPNASGELTPTGSCRFYREPFTVLQQMPHFAIDFSFSPQIVWNQEIYQLTRKRYTHRGEWDEIDLSYDSPGLTFGDAARILRISPIGWMAAIYEQQQDGKVDFPIDLSEVINKTAAIEKLLARGASRVKRGESITDPTPDPNTDPNDETTDEAIDPNTGEVLEDVLQEAIDASLEEAA